MDDKLEIDFGRTAVVDEKAFIAVMHRGNPEGCAEILLEWIRLVPGQEMDSDMIKRWGFLSGTCSTSGGDGDRPYEVAIILLASGNKHGWQRDHFYGSCEKHDEPSTFWAMDFHTLQVVDFGEFSEPGSPITSDVEDLGEGGGAPLFRLKTSKARQAKYLLRLDMWCRQNPDTSYRVRGPGLRGPSKAATSLVLRDVPVACHSPSGQCIRAGICNALFALDGRDAAKAMVQEGPLPAKSLSAVGVWLEKTMKRYSLQNAKVPSDCDAEDWILGRGSGVFIARLQGRDGHNEVIEHIIALDLHKRLVYDSFEKNCLSLKKGILDICVGDGVTFKKLIELKELRAQKVGKRKRKPHKMSRDKQRAVRHRKREENRIGGSGLVEQRGKLKKRVVALSDDEDS